MSSTKKEAKDVQEAQTIAIKTLLRTPISKETATSQNSPKTKS